MSNEKLSPIQQELLDRADSVFAAIGRAATVATDFAKEQLPDIAMQIIAVERAYLTSMMLFPLVFIVAFIFTYRWAQKDSWNNMAPGMSCMLSAFGLLFSLMFSMVHFKQFLTVWVAPKIYLINYIVELVKR